MKQFLAWIVMILVGGGLLWLASQNPQMPSFLQASSSPDFSQVNVKETIQRFDHELAQVISDTAENGLTLPEVSYFKLENISQASVSAQVTTSPQELWETLREEGSQAVLKSLGSSAQVSVNNVSTEVMNQARYQYCRGVVDEYELQQGPQP